MYLLPFFFSNIAANIIEIQRIRWSISIAIARYLVFDNSAFTQHSFSLIHSIVVERAFADHVKQFARQLAITMSRVEAAVQPTCILARSLSP
jgi:predicted lysophospholipase L1 biosynthesis ABC-type transport system permease subunit